MWYGRRVGMLHSNSVYFADSYLFGRVEGRYQEVEAVDGILNLSNYYEERETFLREYICNNEDPE